MAKGEKELRALRARYLEILREDPYLPKELLPRDWWEEKVKAKLKKLRLPA